MKPPRACRPRWSRSRWRSCAGRRVVAGVPLERDLHLHRAVVVGLVLAEVAHVGEQRLLGGVDVADEVADAALVVEPDRLAAVVGPLVAEGDGEAGVEERHHLEPLGQRGGPETMSSKMDGPARTGRWCRCGFPAGTGRRSHPSRADGRPDRPVGEGHGVVPAVLVDLDLGAGRQRVHDRDPDAVQPAGHLVAPPPNFPPACRTVSTTSPRTCPGTGLRSPPGMPRPSSVTCNRRRPAAARRCGSRNDHGLIDGLSTTSYTMWCSPAGPVDPMYMPGRLRTASSPPRGPGSIGVVRGGFCGQARASRVGRWSPRARVRLPGAGPPAHPEGCGQRGERVTRAEERTFRVPLPLGVTRPLAPGTATRGPAEEPGSATRDPPGSRRA